MTFVCLAFHLNQYSSQNPWDKRNEKVNIGMPPVKKCPIGPLTDQNSPPGSKPIQILLSLSKPKILLENMGLETHPLNIMLVTAEKGPLCWYPAPHSDPSGS